MSLTPKIFNLAETRLNPVGIQDFASYLEVPTPQTVDVEDAAVLVELAGRRCYKSFALECNKNLTRIRTGTTDYVRNILQSKHGSVLEHACVTFAIENVSRVFTHELVRHRVGCAYSQESLRFVRTEEIQFPLPDAYDFLPEAKRAEVRELFDNTLQNLSDVQRRLAEICDMDNPDLPFKVKKEFQSANRRLAAEGLLTGIVFTCNHRALRHLIELRTTVHAEAELRYVFNMIARYARAQWPALYQDMYFDASTESLVYGVPVYFVGFTSPKI